MPKETKYVREFLNTVDAAVKKRDNPSWYHIDYDYETVISYLSGLSDYRLRKLFSDNYWNYYPMYSNSRAVTRRSHGSGLCRIMSFICDYTPDLKERVTKCCEGIFAAYALDYLSGKERLKFAKRAAKSKDVRVRKRAAKILPIREAKGMLKDSNEGVRSILIKRIGIDNCASDVYSWNDWYASDAIESMDLSEEEALDRISNLDVTQVWYRHRILKALISKLSPETLLYHLELANDHGGNYSEQTRQHIVKIIENANL